MLNLTRVGDWNYGLMLEPYTTVYPLQAEEMDAAESHYYGCGCPKCMRQLSNYNGTDASALEQEIAELQAQYNDIVGQLAIWEGYWKCCKRGNPLQNCKNKCTPSVSEREADAAQKNAKSEHERLRFLLDSKRQELQKMYETINLKEQTKQNVLQTETATKTYQEREQTLQLTKSKKIGVIVIVVVVVVAITFLTISLTTSKQ